MVVQYRHSDTRKSACSKKTTLGNQYLVVARGGIEPPTRGFSVRPTAVRLRRILQEITPCLSLRLKLSLERSLR